MFIFNCHVSDFEHHNVYLVQCSFSKIKHFEFTKCFQPVIQLSLIATVIEYNVIQPFTHTHTHPNVPSFETVVLSSEALFALKGMSMNISVTVHVTLR